MNQRYPTARTFVVVVVVVCVCKKTSIQEAKWRTLSWKVCFLTPRQEKTVAREARGLTHWIQNMIRVRFTEGVKEVYRHGWIVSKKKRSSCCCSLSKQTSLLLTCKPSSTIYNNGSPHSVWSHEQWEREQEIFRFGYQDPSETVQGEKIRTLLSINRRVTCKLYRMHCTTIHIPYNSTVYKFQP